MARKSPNCLYLHDRVVTPQGPGTIVALGPRTVSVALDNGTGTARPYRELRVPGAG